MGFGTRLTPAERRCYDLIYKALSAFDDIIDISVVSRDADVYKVFALVLSENPQFFYFNRSALQTVAAPSRTTLRLNGSVGRTRARSMLGEAEAAAIRVVGEALDKHSDTYGRILCVYEYLQANTAYDIKELSAIIGGSSVHPNAHNAYGALVERRAVCDGFSAAFQFLMRRMGVECAVIKGMSEYADQGGGAHAWNMLKLDGGYYHLDATWDANRRAETGAYSYDWFLLDDETILADHSWDVRTSPAADDPGLAWHRRNGLYAVDGRAIEDIFAAYAKSAARVVRLRCSENVWSAKPLGEYLSELLLKTALKYRPNVKISYIWNERTACFFAKDV